MKGHPNCPRCRGKGFVLIQGGTPDEPKLSDPCPECEPVLVAAHEDAQRARADRLDRAEDAKVDAWRTR